MAKTYAYLMDDDSEKKKAKGTKKYVINRRITFKNYTDCLFNDKIILQSQQRFKSDCHDVYTAQINKNALYSNDDKTLQTFDKTTTYSHGTNTFKVCESEMMTVKITQNAFLMAKLYYKNLKMIAAICVLNRSIRLNEAIIMIRDYNVFTQDKNVKVRRR